MNEFLLSDESVNSYQMIVRTAGIDISRFEHNPVMYYNHDRSQGVIGRWRNLRIADDRLYGTPEFDENHKLGREIARQVEAGFIRAASIGIEVLQQEGQVVTRCELKEVSICDIPANKNALQLYFADKAVSCEQYAALRERMEQISHSEMERIRQLLRLPAGAPVAEIIEVIEDLVKPLPESSEKILKMALSDGIITKLQYEEIKPLVLDDPLKASKYISGKRKAFEDNFEREFWTFCNNNDRRLRYHRDWRALMPLAKSNFAGFKAFVECLPEHKRITEMIHDAKHGGTPGELHRTLDDYRKNDPAALMRDPALYRRLLDEYRQTKQ